MAQLHYSRWVAQFIIDKFSSEDSMRDYLFSNPSLVFEEGTWVIPIVEERCLPQSSLGKRYGRADIILCRVFEDTKQVKENKKISLSNMEIWIVELKKEEASYENGFKQLFDYMTVLKNNRHIQEDIMKELKSKIEEHLGIKGLQFKDSNTSFILCGSLVAPSFDLIARSKEFTSKDVKNYKKDYELLKKTLKHKGKIDEGFTLIDAVDAACKLFSHISLVKFIRFKRSDETIIYSEHVLGRRARTQISRVDPVELFNEGTIKEDDAFYFRDDNGKDYKEVDCRVSNKRGPSHSFIIKIVAIKGHSDILIPKWPKGQWAKGHYDYKQEKFPIGSTAKTCSIALHKLFEIYNEDELFRYY